MRILETEQEKKSFLITSLGFALLFLLFFYLKFNNVKKANEFEGGGGGGEIAVNFGTSDVGSGDHFQSKEEITATPKEVIATPITKEDLVITDNESSPAIAEIKKTETKTPKKERRENTKLYLPNFYGLTRFFLPNFRRNRGKKVSRIFSDVFHKKLTCFTIFSDAPFSHVFLE